MLILLSLWRPKTCPILPIPNIGSTIPVISSKNGRIYSRCPFTVPIAREVMEFQEEAPDLEDKKKETKVNN